MTADVKNKPIVFILFLPERGIREINGIGETEDG